MGGIIAKICTWVVFNRGFLCEVVWFVMSGLRQPHTLAGAGVWGRCVMWGGGWLFDLEVVAAFEFDDAFVSVGVDAPPHVGVGQFDDFV